MDDVLILGEMLAEHHKKLRNVFEQFRNIILRLNLINVSFLDQN
jgi:hypothetical protein